MTVEVRIVQLILSCIFSVLTELCRRFDHYSRSFVPQLDLPPSHQCEFHLHYACPDGRDEQLGRDVTPASEGPHQETTSRKEFHHTSIEQEIRSRRYNRKHGGQSMCQSICYLGHPVIMNPASRFARNRTPGTAPMFVERKD